ncbi:MULTISPECIES: CvpA family protein [Ectothiorhodospira]|uniref:Membrane protein required for colicin V production n=1 Tax=Ectothiorhodospira marina TaxID=1396821 RepID=A0A1H7NDS4_9GAMM|nr:MULTISPECIES: CvpA family protein [Ectothiorhodospira]MCG5515832.1 CvpA family protein [Ectothiorhodospira sp. 9100]MCG5518918.1 CvpA family protein [Ectothiorhodospira sp. 9905]SEL21653.1 membrane protein required for colicin V production [Ectothiorhodospira marina]
MIWIDLVIVAIIAISAVISLFRGFIKEAISVATWVLAFLVSLTYSAPLSEYLPLGIEDPTLLVGIAFAILFILTLIMGGVVNMLAGQLVKKTGLSGTDRSIGAVFGLARGVAIVAVVVLMAGLTVVPQEPWWQESQLLPQFERIALWMRDFLPQDIAENFSFGD